MAHHDEVIDLMNENAKLKKALEAASGYLMNAKIDLATGCTKETATRTIEGGLKMIEYALDAAVKSAS